jgi:membrane protease YdiL (CAAX protease family)
MILCVLLPPSLLLLVVAIHAAIGGESLEPHWFTWPNLITGTLWIAFLGAGLTEELGWRGFALPHLQRSRSALTSALVIGLVWAVWHLLAPLFGVGSSVTWLEFLSYLVGITAMSIVYVVVFNATRGSLIAVMLLHGANNTSWRFVRDFLPDVDLGGAVVENFLVGALWVIVASICVVIFGPEHLSKEHREIVDLGTGDSAPNDEESSASE